MLHELMDWPEKIKKGYQLAAAIFDQQNSNNAQEQYHTILFFGMGGSGIAGALFKSLVEKKGGLVQVQVLGSARIPALIQPGTLAIVSSYSGNTWEVLDAYNQLQEKQVPIIALAHGGELKALAEKDKNLFFQVPICSAPRASLGFFVGILGNIFEKYAFFTKPLLVDELFFKVTLMVKRFSEQAFFDPFLSMMGSGRSLVCLGVSNDSEVAAYRATTQFNENSKALVVNKNFPEFCHNGIVGLSQEHEKYAMLLMHTTNLTSHEKKGLASVCQLLDDYKIPWYALNVQEKEWEYQLFELLLWADFASLYWGQMRGVEITSVIAIDTLKKYFKSME